MGTVKNLSKIEETKKFSKFCFTGIFDDKFTLLYSDNPPLFNHIVKSSVRIRNKLKDAAIDEEVDYYFVAEGISYFVKFVKMIGKLIIARIFEELPPEFADENLPIHRDIDNIKGGSLTCLSIAQDLLNVLKRSGDQGIIEHLEMENYKLSDICADCLNILEMLGDEGNSVYRDLKKWLIDESDIIAYVSSPLNKQTNFLFDILTPYVKTNYYSFKLALYNLTKITFICTQNGSSSLIEVYTSGTDTVNVLMRTPCEQNVSFNDLSLELRAVKHIFKKLGGRFDFYEQDRFICGSGYFCADFSYKKRGECPVKNKLVLSEEFPDILDCSIEYNSSRRNLYMSPPKKNVLQSHKATYRGFESGEVRFAKMFFLGLCDDTDEY